MSKRPRTVAPSADRGAQHDWTRPTFTAARPDWSDPFKQQEAVPGVSLGTSSSSSSSHIQQCTLPRSVVWHAETVSGVAISVRQGWQYPDLNKSDRSGCHALAPAPAWARPTPPAAGCKALSWTRPFSTTPATPCVGEATPLAGKAAVRLVEFNSSALLLASGSHAGNQSTYAKNGKSVPRMQRLLKEGCCDCAKKCSSQVSLPTVRIMCNLYWNLTSEEQSYLAATSATCKAQHSKYGVRSTALNKAWRAKHGVLLAEWLPTL